MMHIHNLPDKNRAKSNVSRIMTYNNNNNNMISDNW